MSAVSAEARAKQKQQQRDWYLRNKNTSSYIEKAKEATSRWRRLNPEKHATAIRKTKLSQKGLTLDSYNELYARQEGACAICRDPFGIENKPYVDHDHNCCKPHTACVKCLRGLLCSHCNLALGHFRDDQTRLTAALEYLKWFKNK